MSEGQRHIQWRVLTETDGGDVCAVVELDAGARHGVVKKRMWGNGWRSCADFIPTDNCSGPDRRRTVAEEVRLHIIFPRIMLLDCLNTVVL